MSARDFQQVLSMIVSLSTLVIIVYKIRMRLGSFKVWFPFLIITILTIVYYVLIFIDANFIDFLNASDLSATLRLSVQIALLLYAWYMPPRTNHK